MLLVADRQAGLPENFKGADDPAHVARVQYASGLGVHRGQLGVQGLVPLSPGDRFEFGPQPGVGRHAGDVPAFHHRLNPLPGPAYQQRQAPALLDRFDNGIRLRLKIGQAQHLVRLNHVQQMMRDDGLLRRSWFGRTDIKLAIHLAGVGRDDLAVKLRRQA
jgi:hypothetical protein